MNNDLNEKEEEMFEQGFDKLLNQEEPQETQEQSKEEVQETPKKKRGRPRKEEQSQNEEEVYEEPVDELDEGFLRIAENLQPMVDDEEDDENVFEDEPEKSSDDDYYDRVYNTLRDIGVISFHDELEDGVHLDNDSLIKILEEDRNQAAMELFEKNIASRFAGDDDAQAFLAFKLNGGSTKDFFDIYGKSSSIDFEADIDDDEVQDTIIRQYLGTQDYSAEEIEEQIDMLNESGRKQKYATKYLDSLKKSEENRKEELEYRLKQQQEEEARAYEDFVNLIGNTVQNTTEIFGSTVDDRRRAQLFDMVTNANIKRQDGSMVTKFNQKMGEVLADPNKFIILADLLANDLDVNKYNKSIESKAVRKIMRNIDKKPTQKNNTHSTFDWFSQK